MESGIIPEVISSLFPGAGKTGSVQIMARCPFHDDHTPSLSINTVSGLFNCFGCGESGGFFDLYMQVKKVDFNTALVELESISSITGKKSTRVKAKHAPRVVATFYYHDETGQRRYWKKRYEPGFGGGRRTKSFVFYHDQNGHEKKGRGGEPLLYNLHLLVKAPVDVPFFILEGEAKADVLTKWGLFATSLDSGGKSAWRNGFEKYFIDRAVYILPDNDTTGEEYCRGVADHLLAVADSVKILRLPGLPVKGDIIDWLKINGCDYGLKFDAF